MHACLRNPAIIISGVIGRSRPPADSATVIAKRFGTQTDLLADESYKIRVERGGYREVVPVKKPGCYTWVLDEQVGW